MTVKENMEFGPQGGAASSGNGCRPGRKLLLVIIAVVVVAIIVVLALALGLYFGLNGNKTSKGNQGVTDDDEEPLNVTAYKVYPLPGNNKMFELAFEDGSEIIMNAAKSDKGDFRGLTSATITEADGSLTEMTFDTESPFGSIRYANGSGVAFVWNEDHTSAEVIMEDSGQTVSDVLTAEDLAVFQDDEDLTKAFRILFSGQAEKRTRRKRSNRKTKRTKRMSEDDNDGGVKKPCPGLMLAIRHCGNDMPWDEYNFFVDIDALVRVKFGEERAVKALFFSPYDSCAAMGKHPPTTAMYVPIPDRLPPESIPKLNEICKVADASINLACNLITAATAGPGNVAVKRICWKFATKVAKGHPVVAIASGALVYHFCQKTFKYLKASCGPLTSPSGANPSATDRGGDSLFLAACKEAVQNAEEREWPAEFTIAIDITMKCSYLGLENKKSHTPVVNLNIPHTNRTKLVHGHVILNCPGPPTMFHLDGYHDFIQQSFDHQEPHHYSGTNHLIIACIRCPENVTMEFHLYLDSMNLEDKCLKKNVLEIHDKAYKLYDQQPIICPQSPTTLGGKVFQYNEPIGDACQLYSYSSKTDANVAFAPHRYDPDPDNEHRYKNDCWPEDYPHVPQCDCPGRILSTFEGYILLRNATTNEIIYKKEWKRKIRSGLHLGFRGPGKVGYIYLPWNCTGWPAGWWPEPWVPNQGESEGKPFAAQRAFMKSVIKITSG